MPKTHAVQPFKFSTDDPLADEHRLVSDWVEHELDHTNPQSLWRPPHLENTGLGKQLLAVRGDGGVRMVRAALAQSRHWEREAAAIRATAQTDFEQMNAHQLPGYMENWSRRLRAFAVIDSLMRRQLPFHPHDLAGLVDWCLQMRWMGPQIAPLGPLVKALERQFTDAAPDASWAERLTKFAGRLRESNDKPVQRLATRVEQLQIAARSECAAADERADGSAKLERRPSPEPAPCGTPGVLWQLKRLLRLPGDSEERTTDHIGPDGFPLAADSPLRREHELLNDVLESAIGRRSFYFSFDLEICDAGKAILAMDPAERGRVLLAAGERQVHAALLSMGDMPALWQAASATFPVVMSLIALPFEMDRPGLSDLSLLLSAYPRPTLQSLREPAQWLVDQLRLADAETPLTEGERFAASLLRDALIPGPPMGVDSDLVAVLTRMIGDGAMFALVPGEVWADAVNESVFASRKEQTAWLQLLKHALTATQTKPSARWLKTAEGLIAKVGPDTLTDHLGEWLPLVDKKGTRQQIGHYSGDVRGAAETLNEENAICLRGLLWMLPLLPASESLLRGATSLAISAYRKVPGVGPRAVKVGNAAVYALSQFSSPEAVGQLAILKTRVKFGSAQKEIEKAFTRAAEALGLPREEIEELGVPTYGLEEGGRLQESVGDYTAEIVVSGSDADLNWTDAKGKALKAVPTKVRSEHKEDLQELKQSLKDIQAMLPAQRDRIDGMFLRQTNWKVDVWRERYLDHPLVGTIARRLIWCVDGAPALFLDGQPTDVAGETIAHGKTAEITLWHPAGRPLDEVLAWRNRLETLPMTQPFKQAHREVYLLTDAERRTATYSNRFAAHILRQHQFNALCAARGWKNRLRLMVDDSYEPPYRLLPEWGLRAEFWVEGIGDAYGADTNDSGVYLRLATDQVRFYRINAAPNFAHAGGGRYVTYARGPGDAAINEPLPLTEVPLLVFSEIMRDVDLFVGVGSVGNDPTWNDGGPEGRFIDYWQSFSFGELSGTASTRKQVLERLVPRLKIADRCSFSERFLVVRGELRTYKIHLGSGNILMEPNDQYLCIVPNSRQRAAQGDLHLPFEGDQTLSIILSKALLLAADTKIKDASIVQQIKLR
ncbi:MAG: DUF4132 domain-containing protein [Planctomycetaceae bacterium]|nr:DUF4132 domain-containing protein [Planctomycetaceae bacterium]